MPRKYVDESFTQSFNEILRNPWRNLIKSNEIFQISNIIRQKINFTFHLQTAAARWDWKSKRNIFQRRKWLAVVTPTTSATTLAIATKICVIWTSNDVSTNIVIRSKKVRLAKCSSKDVKRLPKCSSLEQWHSAASHISTLNSEPAIAHLQIQKPALHQLIKTHQRMQKIAKESTTAKSRKTRKIMVGRWTRKFNLVNHTKVPIVKLFSLRPKYFLCLFFILIGKFSFVSTKSWH